MSKVVLTWSAPTTRSDGTALALGEIAVFNVFRNGNPVAINLPPVASMSYEDSTGTAADVYTAQTVLTDGTSSACAPVSPVVVAGPSVIADLAGKFYA